MIQTEETIAEGKMIEILTTQTEELGRQQERQKIKTKIQNRIDEILEHRNNCVYWDNDRTEPCDDYALGFPEELKSLLERL